MPNTGDTRSDAGLRRLFSWLTKSGVGVKFGSRPIGWYQQHQMCAIDVIRDRAQRATNVQGPRVEFDVKESKGEVYAKHGKRARWVRVGSTRELYAAADRCGR